MNEERIMAGGCLCGAVRYRVTAQPFATEYCHCRMCQKSVGSPVVCWMDYQADQVSWTAGKPSEYQSSETVRRGFCGECGTTLSFRDTRYPRYLTLTIASLDDPNPVIPERHIYTKSQLEWLNIDDGCPRLPRGLGEG